MQDTQEEAAHRITPPHRGIQALQEGPATRDMEVALLQIVTTETHPQSRISSPGHRKRR